MLRIKGMVLGPFVRRLTDLTELPPKASVRNHATIRNLFFSSFFT